MSLFDELTQTYRLELSHRADALVEEFDPSLPMEDFVLTVQVAYNDETERFDQTIESSSKRRMTQALLIVPVVLIAAVLIGVSTSTLWLGFLAGAIGLIVLGLSLPKVPDLTVLRDQAEKEYRARVQAGLAARQARMKQEAQDELDLANREVEEATLELYARLEPARASLELWQAAQLAPSAQPYGVSPAGAEIWVRDWMRYMGAEHAETTQFVSDGGIDVEDAHFIAQVKHYTGSVGVAEMREHIGVAAVDTTKRQPLFFTSGNYPASVIEVADRASMPLFVYRVEEAEVEAINLYAQVVLEAGLNLEWRDEDSSTT